MTNKDTSSYAYMRAAADIALQLLNPVTVYGRPAKFIEFIDHAGGNSSIPTLLATIEKKEPGSHVGSKEWAHNRLMMHYAYTLANAVTVLGENYDKGPNPNENQEFYKRYRAVEPLLAQAAAKAFRLIRLPKEYQDFQKTLFRVFGEDVKNNGMIEEFRVWVSLSEEQRKELLIRLAKQVLKTARSITEGFDEINLEVSFHPLPKGEWGNASIWRGIQINESILRFEDPREAILTICHEALEIIFMISVIGKNDTLFNLDWELRRATINLKTNFPDFYENILYPVDPFEQHETEKRIAKPIIDALDRDLNRQCQLASWARGLAFSAPFIR